MTIRAFYDDIVNSFQKINTLFIILDNHRARHFTNDKLFNIQYTQNKMAKL